MTSTTYDGCGRPLLVTNPDGSSLALTYDVFGRVERERHTATDGTQARDVSTEYAATGRVQSTYDAVRSLTRTFAYAADGTVTTSEVEGSRTTASTIDGRGLLRDRSAICSG
ncbi:MAG: hypothetical protein QMC79_10500, partial [Anaerosomatales bacterium]|nr:hypothetical protein [Anaerosomatales bacterium]